MIFVGNIIKFHVHVHLFVLSSNKFFSLVSDEKSNREEQSVAQTGSLDN